MDELLEGLSEEQIEKQKNLWKIVGRETKAGKALFSLYKCHEPPKINYPKPKQKTQQQIDRQTQSRLSTKKCPQKTQIQYPQMPQKEGPKIYPVDLIPKRKNETVIKDEIDNFYSKIEIPVNRGVDRGKQVAKLQQKFKNQRGALPKDAQLPAVNMKEGDYDEEIIKQRAAMRLEKKFKNYTGMVKNADQSSKKSEKEQLNDMFDAIVKEIQERQEYLDSIDHLDQPKLKQKIKMEMIQRVSQLQKIGQMRQKMK